MLLSQYLGRAYERFTAEACYRDDSGMAWTSCKRCGGDVPAVRAHADPFTGDILCPRDALFAGSMLDMRKEKGFFSKPWRPPQQDRR